MALAVGELNAQGARHTAPYQYALYGLVVRSDLSLPFPPSPALLGVPADVELRLREDGLSRPAAAWTRVTEVRCHCTLHGGEVVTAVYREADDTWIGSRAAGWFRVGEQGRVVDVYAETADERELGVAIAGQVLVCVLHRQHRLCLHASAVEVDGGAVAFLGANGRGKSTMAAALVANGGTLLTDDVLVLRQQDAAVWAEPGLPLLKLTADSAAQAGFLPGDLPGVTAANEHKLVARYERADAAPLRALYVLDRDEGDHAHTSDVTIRRLTDRESMAILLASVSLRNYLTPAEGAQLFPLLTRLVKYVPVRQLRFPSGHDRQGAVVRGILADVRGGNVR